MIHDNNTNDISLTIIGLNTNKKKKSILWVNHNSTMPKRLNHHISFRLPPPLQLSLHCGTCRRNNPLHITTISSSAHANGCSTRITTPSRWTHLGGDVGHPSEGQPISFGQECPEPKTSLGSFPRSRDLLGSTLVQLDP
ncbi:hypothetical protein NPIL_625691 [Nephila pilipes]|uniref:Uncharacterized protein n=1 Tax=Nephila pilipes TaxID=299642 RepID=A0A8X6U599_NEPPI|nr:hypothetical protein NPIL_625691 [Nephila pilipes]